MAAQRACGPMLAQGARERPMRRAAGHDSPGPGHGVQYRGAWAAIGAASTAAPDWAGARTGARESCTPLIRACSLQPVVAAAPQARASVRPCAMSSMAPWRSQVPPRSPRCSARAHHSIIACHCDGSGLASVLSCYFRGLSDIQGWRRAVARRPVSGRAAAAHKPPSFPLIAATDVALYRAVPKCDRRLSSDGGSGANLPSPAKAQDPRPLRGPVIELARPFVVRRRTRLAASSSPSSALLRNEDLDRLPRALENIQPSSDALVLTGAVPLARRWAHGRSSTHLRGGIRPPPGASSAHDWPSASAARARPLLLPDRELMKGLPAPGGRSAALEHWLPLGALCVRLVLAHGKRHCGASRDKCDRTSAPRAVLAGPPGPPSERVCRNV